MIVERGMWQGVSTETGETLKGYYLMDDFPCIQPIHKCDCISYRIDISTLEPIAVAQKTEFDKEGYFHTWCPNCNKENMNPNAHFKYCPECGQRWLDWNANAADVERGENK